MVRAISISLVLYNHSGGVFSFISGVLGVEIFFVLSGFLIGQILYRSIVVKDDPGAKNLFEFWKRRWWRTLPLYYLVIMAAFILCGFCIGKNILYYVFFLQNHFYGIQFYPVTWSLVVEEWFYLLIPILLLLLCKWKGGSKKIIAGIVSFILLITVFKIVWVLTHNTHFSGIRASVPLRLDSLCFGVLLSFIKLSKPVMYDTLKKPVFFFTGSVIIAGCLFVLYGQEDDNSVIDKMPLLRALWFSVASMAIAFLVPFMETNNFINTIAASKKWIWYPFTVISVLTYSIYLLHMPVKGFYYEHFGTLPFPAVGSTLTLFVLSFLVYKFFEHPMTRLREK